MARVALGVDARDIRGMSVQNCLLDTFAGRREGPVAGGVQVERGCRVVSASRDRKFGGSEGSWGVGEGGEEGELLAGYWMTATPFRAAPCALSGAWIGGLAEGGGWGCGGELTSKCTRDW